MPPSYPNGHIESIVTGDRTAAWLGARAIEVREGHALVEMTVAEHMLNGHGTCHGGMIFTLADIAMSYASNSEGVPGVGAAVDIEYIAPARSGALLRATATQRMRYGRADRHGVFDLTVLDAGTGELIAVATGRDARSMPR